MAYSRARLSGEPQVGLGTTGGAVVGIPNWGVSVITATTAEVYVLAPPVAGCDKTIVFNTYSTTALPVVKLSTNAGQSVSIMGVSTNITVLKSAATKSTVFASVVQLKGLSSTQWLLVNAFPSLGALTTGSTAASNAITASST